MDITTQVKDALEKNGIFVADDEQEENLILDSLQFISVIVEVEKAFDIEIDDEYLIQNQPHSLNDFIVMIEKLLNPL